MATAACATVPEEIKQKFFGIKGKGYAEARAICRTCPIVDDCLALALQTDEEYGERHGVWAGLSANERDLKFGRLASRDEVDAA